MLMYRVLRKVISRHIKEYNQFISMINTEQNRSVFVVHYIYIHVYTHVIELLLTRDP